MEKEVFVRKRDGILPPYYTHVINSIEKKRFISIKEFYKTDLNSDVPIERVNEWYDIIVLNVKKTPPEYFVKCLEIIEDENGIIVNVNYVYFWQDEEIYDTEFIVKRS